MRAFLGEEDGSPPSFWLTGGVRVQPHSCFSSSWALCPKTRSLYRSSADSLPGNLLALPGSCLLSLTAACPLLDFMQVMLYHLSGHLLFVDHLLIDKLHMLV